MKNTVNTLSCLLVTVIVALKNGFNRRPTEQTNEGFDDDV